MTSKLEEFFQFIEARRYQDAASHRHSAQDEYFRAKSILGTFDRNESEKITKIFDFVERGEYQKASASLEQAKETFRKWIQPNLQKSYEGRQRKPEQYPPDKKNDKTSRNNIQSLSNSIITTENRSGESRMRGTDVKSNEEPRQIKEVNVRDEHRKLTSEEASERLRKDNPNIADLSDTNRPTKIAERLSELYDNEWTEAYVHLTSKLKCGERQTVDNLYEIVLAAYDFCSAEAKHQVQLIQEAALSIVKHGELQKRSNPAPNQEDTYPLAQFRKTIAEVAVERLKKKYLEIQKKKYSFINRSKQTEMFVAKCVELTWWMCVQLPPVYVYRGESGPVNQNLYKSYTKSGNNVDYYIWPPLLLHQDGPLLSKGVVQAK